MGEKFEINIDFLANFNSKDKIKEEDFKESQTLFSIFDTNGDKEIDSSELNNIFKQLKNYSAKNKDDKREQNSAIFDEVEAENFINENKTKDGKTFADLGVTVSEVFSFLNNLLTKNDKREHKISSAKFSKGESKYKFKLGKNINGTRMIGPESVAEKINIDNRDILADKINSILNGMPAATNNNQNSIGGFAQGRRGDCYYLATINAIKNSKDGQKILNKTIRKNPDNSYTITLPGAVLLKNSLIQKGFKDKCEVTGVYKISSEAVEKLKKQAGKAYSSGDLKVMMLELAMESYRAELKITNKNLEGLNDSSDWQTAEGSGSTREEDNLWGGYTWDAGFLLTGEKANVYLSSQDKKNNLKLYKKGKYGYVTREQMEQQCLKSKVGRTFGQTEKGLSEISNLTTSDSDLSPMLNKIMYNESKYAITVSFRCEDDGDDGVTQAGNYHALTVLRVTESTVYVLNPWLKDEKGSEVIEPIPREDFEAMCSELVLQKMDLETINQTHEQISKPVSTSANSNPAQRQQDLIQILKNLKYKK